MTTYYKYRVRCTTENAYKEWILASTEAVPTVCPTNTAHTIDTVQTTIIETIEDTIVTIKEEDTPTGGHYCTETVNMSATGNGVTTATWSWPFPINILNLNVITSTVHNGDTLNCIVAKNTIVGAVTAAVAPASTWTNSTNYVASDNVIYGGKTYSCITTTDSYPVPTNTAFWRRGFMIPVSSTVVQNVKVGFHVNIWNGVTTNELGRVLYVDTVNSKIYMEFSAADSYSPTPLTIYVRMSVKPVYKYEFGLPAMHDFGTTKIGSSYVPADVILYVEYTNNSSDTKEVIGRIEYLY